VPMRRRRTPVMGAGIWYAYQHRQASKSLDIRV